MGSTKTPGPGSMRILAIFLLVTISLAQVGLHVESRPSGADVSVDGVTLGKTPIDGKEIKTGEHSIKLTLDGYAPLDYVIDITPAKLLKLDFQLNRLHPVTFTTNEKGLKFKLNDDYTWDSKKEKFLMEAGDHLLEVFRGETLVETRDFTIDQPTNINFEFE